MHLAFDRPGWLLLLVTLLPVGWLAWRSVPHLGRVRAVAAGVLRSLVILLLTAGLARPSIVRHGEGTSVVIVADASRSVPMAQRQAAQSWIESRVVGRSRPGDRVGVVTVARTPEIQQVPSAAAAVDTLRHAGDAVGSDLAAGVRTALAMLPADTVNRLLLVSDGVETAGSVADAAERAASLGVPVDVVVLERPAPRDVMVESVRAPARARRGQVIDARVVLRATAPTSGRLLLRLNGRPVDLDPRGPGEGLAVKLDAGPNAFSVPLPLELSGAARLEAVFEPADAAFDAIVENDVGGAITFVGGEGRVLLVGDGPQLEPLAQAIRASRLEVDVVPPDALGPHVAAGDFDACVLADVPRWMLDAESDRGLASSVRDLGCGLVMLGGSRSFGAGGWNDSEVASVLPVDMVPPQERRLPTGALALVIDCSGSMSMPVAGTGVSQQQIACEAAIKAIRALTPEDEVTVVAFSGSAKVVVPLTRLTDVASVEARIRSIEPQGGTNMYPALGAAMEELEHSDALTRHLVVLTDGATSGDPAEGFARAKAMIDRGMTMSTVAIGDSSDGGLLARLAKIADGRYYAVRDDQSRVSIPQIFIKEAQLVRRSMLWEGQPFVPARVTSAEWMRGGEALPPVAGYVIAGTRPDPAQLGLVSAGDAKDPILAWWNHGLGRAVAFTSDLGGRWTPGWPGWPGFQPFVGGMLRWVLRPTAPADLTVRTRLDGDEAEVEVEATGESARSAESAEARVLQPDGSAARVTLRQVAPGRWSGRFSVDRAGSYLVNAAVGAGGRPMFTQASVSVPYAREFRTASADPERLQAVARRTGGRVLAVGDPAADLFLNQGMPVPESMRQAWDLCVELAAVLFLLDVAVRRLALEWPKKRAKEAPRDATRVTEAWRLARRAAQGAAPVPASAAPSEPSGATLAMDASDAPRNDTPSQPAASPEAPIEPQDDSPLGRLRAAKRRARDGGQP